LNAQLAGPTLGEATSQEEDLKSWVKRSKKQARELAARRAKELELQDQQFQDAYAECTVSPVSTLTTADLAGMRVAHDYGDIEEGQEMVLTIKDKGVLDDDDEGDELISTTLAERERLRENLENKIKKPKYDPYAQEEYETETGEKKLLSKYDDEERKVCYDFPLPANGKTFVIGSTLAATSKLNNRDGPPGHTAISLDYDSNLLQ
jgi:U4/U6.U5 tri-snRNP-associated protein 1